MNNVSNHEILIDEFYGFKVFYKKNSDKNCNSILYSYYNSEEMYAEFEINIENGVNINYFELNKQRMHNDEEYISNLRYLSIVLNGWYSENKNALKFMLENNHFYRTNSGISWEEKYEKG